MSGIEFLHGYSQCSCSAVRDSHYSKHRTDYTICTDIVSSVNDDLFVGKAVSAPGGAALPAVPSSKKTNRSKDKYR